MSSLKRSLESPSELELQTIFEHEIRQDIKIESIEAKNIKKEPLEFSNDLTENQRKVEDSFIFEHDHRRNFKELIETINIKKEPGFEVSKCLTENQRKVDDSFIFEHDRKRKIKEELIETKNIKKEPTFEVSNNLKEKHNSECENQTIFEYDLPKRIKLEVCTLNGHEKQVFQIKKANCDATFNSTETSLTDIANQKYKDKIETEYQPDSFEFDSDFKKEIKMEVKTEIKTEPMTESSSLQIFKIDPQTQTLTKIIPEAYEKIIANPSTSNATNKLQKALSFPGNNVPFQIQWQGMAQNSTPQGYNQPIFNYPMQVVKGMPNGTIILRPTMQKIQFRQPQTASNMTKIVPTSENQTIKQKFSPPTAYPPQTLPMVFEVTCKGLKATFHKNLFHSGGKGHCIQFQNQMLVPNEFELKAGSRSKKYKASIYYQGQPLQKLFDAGLLIDNILRKKFVHDKDVSRTIDKEGL